MRLGDQTLHETLITFLVTFRDGLAGYKLNNVDIACIHKIWRAGPMDGGTGSPVNGSRGQDKAVECTAKGSGGIGGHGRGTKMSRKQRKKNIEKK